jgi:uncharacterized coiled-coil protein SlyX
MNEASRERLEQVEASLAHLEHQVEQMNEVLVHQGRQMELLQKQVRRQSAVLEGIELDRIKANQTKPPHYHE